MGTSYEELEKKVANEEIFEGKTEQELSSQFLGVNVIPASAVSVDFSKKLGEGAYGSVYKGLWMGREVALKQIDTTSPGMKKRLRKIYGKHLKKEQIPAKISEIVQREILRASTLSHPNIVQFYGIYVYENPATKTNIVYQVMELCNRTLEITLKGTDIFELPWSLRW